MQARLWCSVLALGGATALAVVQPTAQVQQGPHAGDRPAYDQQLVTVEGCLRREHAPELPAREIAADPETSAIFVLADADVRSRIDTKPGAEGAADPKVLGPAGIQNERAGLPVEGAPDAPEPTDRLDSAAVDGAPTPPADRDRYVVLGLAEDRLAPLAGQRVAMTGQFEAPLAAVDPEAAAAEPVGTTGTARWPGHLPRFRATSVKPVPGICPPKP